MGKRSVRSGAGGSQALLRVLTPGSSIQTGSKWFIQESGGPGTGFQSFAEYSRVLHGSGKLPEAASPAGRVRTQTAAGEQLPGWRGDGRRSEKLGPVDGSWDSGSGGLMGRDSCRPRLPVFDPARDGTADR